jgi:hypothetical protein
MTNHQRKIQGMIKSRYFGKEILLGTNKHPNKQDKMKHDLELFPFVKVKQENLDQ